MREVSEAKEEMQVGSASTTVYDPAVMKPKPADRVQALHDEWRRVTAGPFVTVRGQKRQVGRGTSSRALVAQVCWCVHTFVYVIRQLDWSVCHPDAPHEPERALKHACLRKRARARAYNTHTHTHTYRPGVTKSSSMSLDAGQGYCVHKSMVQDVPVPFAYTAAWSARYIYYVRSTNVGSMNR